MTTHQPGRPKPPPPNTSWLDYVTDPSQLPMASEIPYAREELADLRGHLKLQTENVLALMQERDSLRAKVAELRGAILGLGELPRPDAWFSDCGDYLIRMRSSSYHTLSALVAKLRAEAPAQGKEGQ